MQPSVNLLEFRTFCATKLCLFLHTTRKSYLSLHHALTHPLPLSSFSYSLVSRTAFGAFSFFLSWTTFQHISTFWLRSVFSIFKLTARTPIDQTAGKVWANNLLTSSTWQTEDYFFNGKFWLKTLNPTMEALALYFKQFFFNDESP